MTANSVASPLTLRALGAGDAAALAELFSALTATGDTQFFEPHPLTPAEAARLVQYRGKDLYLVAEENGSVLGYGLLRGWDEGFVNPSLGIAIHPRARGARLGRLLMHYLHTLAQRRGAARVRLRVRADNIRAANLYRSLGYEFENDQGEYLVGWLTLETPAV